MNVTEISLTLLTPVVGLLGLWIAWQQMRINKDRLRHELFEKRYAIFRAAGTFLGSIMREGKATEKAQADFKAGIQGASFLFDFSVTELLDEIWEKAIDLETKQFEIKDLPVGNERSKLAAEIGELKKWLIHQFKPLEERCSKFLDLGHMK
jgi:hypothetical protein